MTNDELNQKYSDLTGLRYDISPLIEAAETDEAKHALYYHLVWNIKQGAYTQNEEIKALYDEVYDELKGELGIDDEELEEPGGETPDPLVVDDDDDPVVDGGDLPTEDQETEDQDAPTVSGEDIEVDPTEL